MGEPIPDRLAREAHRRLWDAIVEALPAEDDARERAIIADAIRAALDWAIRVALEDKAGTRECEACGCWNTSERIALAIETLRG